MLYAKFQSCNNYSNRSNTICQSAHLSRKERPTHYKDWVKRSPNDFSTTSGLELSRHSYFCSSSIFIEYLPNSLLTVVDLVVATENLKQLWGYNTQKFFDPIVKNVEWWKIWFLAMIEMARRMLRIDAGSS